MNTNYNSTSVIHNKTAESKCYILNMKFNIVLKRRGGAALIHYFSS